MIWLTAALIGGLLCLVAYGLGRDALRGFEHDATGPISASGAVTGRVNLLLLGIDQRVGTNEPTRTDTMLLLTFDPRARTAGMLSINRDLWVTFPDGRGAGRINIAHLVGEAQHLPGGGPALARETVQSVFDLPVPYYVRFNFSAFERLIDRIGGVDVAPPGRFSLRGTDERR
jgi:LCP family protein required for cell wall assembly